jgi:excinuclease UvrABC nuclease subunit
MLPRTLDFAASRDVEFFAAVPAAPAVFLLRGEAGSEPYVSKTANLRRRLLRLLSAAQPGSRRLNLRGRVCRLEYAPAGSDFESGMLLYTVLRREFPASYAGRLRWRPAPLVRFILENEYPRATVTTRLLTLRGRSLYYGPFPARAAAEAFLNDALDFFKLRRCADDLHPDPAFPGCIYSEMKMCLAPCFRGCTGAEYRRETGRVQAFLDTAGESLKREVSARRDQASAALEFENAAALHARLEKLSSVLARLPGIVRRIDQLGGVVVQPSAEPDRVALFRIEAGRLNGPIQFPLQHKSAEPGAAGKQQSMEARLLDTLAAVAPLAPAPARETMEQLAYLKRWYYRISKTGEIFLANEKNELPLRRLVRGIARVFRGEKPAAELTETAHDYRANPGRSTELNPEDYKA